MFIGHFVIAYLLILLFPNVPPLVFLLGVSFPDVLWAILVPVGVEKVGVNPDSPLQKYLKFISYPYSHSLLLGSLVACIPGAIFALILTPLAGALFVLASASHWFLDTLVHLRDLPLLGFGRNRKVGLGLWNYPKVSFAFEYLFYAAATLLLVKSIIIPALLVLGTVFHLINANSFLGFTKTNPTKTPTAYAVLALVGFVGFSTLAYVIIV